MTDDTPLRRPLTATKNGTVITLSDDHDPTTRTYTVVDMPGFLLLLQDDLSQRLPEVLSAPPERATVEPDRETILREAFARLGGRITANAWTSSATPFADLHGDLRDVMNQPSVREDVRAHLEEDPAVGCAMDMLFTQVAMSARARWQDVPDPARGTAARGWFLGRWIPTFLMIDGPILRFLKSPAFRRASPQPALLRAVRRFFDEPSFMQLRHAFAHWSFDWVVDGGESFVVALDQRSAAAPVRMARTEADAFHIITFAVVECLFDTLVRRVRHGG